MFLLSLLCNTVSFPFMEPLVRLVVDHLEPGKAMDFLAKSASKIIAARKMDSDHSALVNVWLYWILLTNSHLIVLIAINI